MKIDCICVFSDLKDLSATELTDTFGTFSSNLKKLFDEKKSVSIYSCIELHNKGETKYYKFQEVSVVRSTEYDFATIITQTLTDEQYHAMVDKLAEELLPNSVHADGIELPEVQCHSVRTFHFIDFMVVSSISVPRFILGVHGSGMGSVHFHGKILSHACRSIGSIAGTGQGSHGI